MKEPDRIRFWIGGIALVIVGCFVYALVEDALDGFRFTRRTPSWARWVGGLTLAGLGAFLLESARDWVFEPDRWHSTGPRRSTRITIAVLVLTALAAGLWIVWRVTAS